MTKKILSILLAGLLLLSLFACGENITPTTDTPDDVPVAEEEPEKVIIETEMGTMPLYYEDYELLERDAFKAQYATGITEPIVRVFTSQEEIKPLIHPTLWTVYPNKEGLLGSYVEYDDAFFETKKVVSITFYTLKRIELKVDYVYSQTDKDGVTTYHAKVVVRDSVWTVEGSSFTSLYYGTVTIAVDKKLDITPENLTINLVDLRK